MVRVQRLGIWFGQLGPVHGSVEGDGGSRVFRRGVGRFFTNGWTKEGRGRHKEQNAVTEEKMCV